MSVCDGGVLWVSDVPRRECICVGGVRRPWPTSQPETLLVPPNASLLFSPRPARGRPAGQWHPKPAGKAGEGAEACGARRSRGSQSTRGEAGKPRGLGARARPFSGSGPWACFLLRGPGSWGQASGALRVRELGGFSWRSGREGAIYRSNNPRFLRQWNPAGHAHRHSRPPLAPAPSGLPAPRASLAASRNRAAPRALVWPKLAGPRVRGAPAPPPVRHGARAGSGAAGSPSSGGCESWGSVQDSGAYAGPGCDLSAGPGPAGGAEASRRCPLESVHSAGSPFWFCGGGAGMLYEGDECFRELNVLGVSMKGGGDRLQPWLGG